MIPPRLCRLGRFRWCLFSNMRGYPHVSHDRRGPLAKLRVQLYALRRGYGWLSA